MIRRQMTGVLGILLLASTAAAQAPVARWNWRQGQVLTYQAQQSSIATDRVGDNKDETKTEMKLTKRWQVLAVDASGAATLQLTLLAMSLETTSPGGKTLRFDSANPDKCTPELKDQLTKYVGAPLAVLRVDPVGRVLEVKDSKFGPGSRYENELPFIALLSGQAIQAGQTWERAYQITLDPPQGTGEKYQAVQRYTCKTVGGGVAVIGLTTELKTVPKAVGDQIPLLQLQPEGELAFDVQAGRLKSANLKTVKELMNHQGEGSSYRLESSYSEQLLDAR
jgi:hypothetical protein